MTLLSKVSDVMTYLMPPAQRAAPDNTRPAPTEHRRGDGSMPDGVDKNGPVQDSYGQEREVESNRRSSHKQVAPQERENYHSYGKHNERSTPDVGKSYEELKRKSDHLRRYMRKIEEERRVEVLDFRKQMDSLQRDLDSARQREINLDSQYERQKQELHVVKDELRRAEAQHEITRSQLGEKASELQSAHLFIDQTDSLSGADVIAVVNALNAEILQGAAFIAESVQYADKGQAPPPEILQKVQDMIGKDLTQALISGRGDNERDIDPTIVQLALQACLVYCCAYVTRAWILGGDGAVLENIYAKILEKDKQSAAGRWRSMTRAHVANFRQEDQPESVRWILAWMRNILLLAGCSPQQLNASLNKIQGRVSTISNMTLRLRVTIGENITSVDFGLIASMCGDAYAPDAMDDTYAEDRRSSKGNTRRERVSGTTELGLRSRVKTDGGIVEAIMLKPKVVLCSALENLLL